MKKHIKLFSFILLFFSSVSYSYSQSTGTEDSIQQENSSTTPDQETNSSTLDKPGEINTSNDSTGYTAGELNGSNTTPGKTDNELLNAVINNNNAPAQEYVKGTRLPNEYSSGRTGGQFNYMQNPATAMPHGNPYHNNRNSGNGSTGASDKKPTNPNGW